MKYIHASDVHNLKSPNIIVPELIRLFHPQSVIDVGCGIGTFLKVFKDNHVSEILGIDGSWVDRKQLMIQKEEFLESDLEKHIVLNKKFDMVLCLEVVEHLKPSSADIIVSTLTSLGNTIIFSAALPDQGGQNHLNEQPITYWQEKFESYGFKYYDIFREKFWNENDIDWWYKQNMFLVAKEPIYISDRSLIHQIKKISTRIHPDLYYGQISNLKEARIENERKDYLLKSINSGSISLKKLLKIGYKKCKKLITRN